MMKDASILHQQIPSLVHLAKEMGATCVAAIPTSELHVDERFAAMCGGDTSCPQYGLSALCPPHVGGPAEFRKWQLHSEISIVVRIELPTSLLLSDQRSDVFLRLHAIVASVEREAVKLGFPDSRGFAGGSCKDLFCQEHAGCNVLSENTPCIHSDIARPSMSGFGVDVSRLMASCGWMSSKTTLPGSLKENDEYSWIAGLVMIG